MRAAVFSPDGKHVAGFVIKRPDVAGMVRRADAFVAWDSLTRMDEKNLLVSRPEDGLDDAALTRLDLDWDRCIMWSGMDAKTTEGKPLGYVSDAEYDERTGRVTRRHGARPHRLLRHRAGHGPRLPRRVHGRGRSR